MASIVVSGDTSGAITIAAPAVAGTNTLTLPASTGTLVVTGGAQTIEFADGTVSAPSITNSGDTNTGIYFPAADTIAFTEGGVESMRIDSSGNVGIGTSSPSARLDVNGGRSFFAANSEPYSIYLRYNGSTSGFFIGSPSADAMSFSTSNGSEKMRINSSGNVGIGTTAPSGRLSLVTPSGTTNTLTITGSGTAGAFTQYANTAGSFYVGLDNSAGSDFGSAYSANLYHGGNYPMLFWTNSTERMRITSAGLFGFNLSDPATFSSGVAQAVIERTSAGNNTIALALVNRSGTTNTSVSLDFNPNTNIALAQIRAFRTDSGFGGGTDLRFLNYDGSALAERMRITAGGSLLVGTSTFASGQAGVLMRGTNSSGTDEVIQSRTPGTGSIINTGFYNDNGRVGTIVTNGSNTSYNTSSDYRLKEDIAPMTGALAKVQQLKPVNYKWKSDGSDGQGFIAHELQAVVPDCVTGEKDAVDAEGNPIHQGVDVSFLVATLTAAIQEQQALITQLQADVAALKGAK
jgi:hypothetical protein